MDATRRHLLRAGLAAGGAAVAGMSSSTTWAQTAYPNRPIRMIVGFAPGSGADLVARSFSLKLGERMGQTIVIENKAAAGGLVATETVAQASPDGYTLLFVTGAITTSAVLNPNMRLDIQRDLAPVAMIGKSEVAMLVGPKLKNVRTLAEFVREAKAQPGKLNYGSSGVGGSTHFFTEQLAELMGIKLTHIPYKGAGPAAIALRASEVDVILATQSVAAPLLGDQIRALAVTGAKRSALMPGVPTFNEAGFPSFDASVFSGLLAPPNMSPQMILRLNREANETLKDPDVIKRLSTEAGLTLVGGTPESFAEEIAKNLAQMRKTAEVAGIKAGN